jgi:carbamoyl-phosphate synthase large subunit
VGETWIGVTGFYATDNPHPGLAVIRALREADPSWRIVALPYDRLGTAAYAADLIDAHALVPAPAAGPAALLERFRAITERHPLHIVIPTVDAELPHYVALRPALRRLGIATGLPSATALRAREKRRLPELGRRASVAVPDTTVLPSKEAVERMAPRLCYPQVLKGAMVDSKVVHWPEDFVVAARELADLWGYPLVTQPVIPGEEYDVAGVAQDGELLGAAVMKKLGVTSKGTAWAGVTVDEPDLVEQARRLARALEWEGGMEAEFIRSADGVAYCFEINGRFPSWIALAAAAGANLPAMLVHMLQDERVEPAVGRAGRLFTRALVERVFTDHPLDRLKDGDLKPNALPAGVARPTTRGAGVGGTVAITGLNAADNPSPGLTVARSLLALPQRPRLIGLTHEVLATGAYVDETWDEVRMLPFPSREEGGYAEALIEQCRAAGADCLIPTLDIELPIVSRLQERLAAAGIATLVPPPEALAAAAKPKLPALAEHGFRLPSTTSVAGHGDVARAVEELGTPCVFKGPMADAKIVRTEEEARVAAGRLAATWGFPLIAQSFVEGEELGIAAVADRRHRIVGCVAVRKEIRSPNGNTWGGSSVVDRVLWSLAERFAEALQWVGPFELEVIRHPRRGPHLLEANPRFPAWVYLSAGAGANLPEAAVRLARGERVPTLSTRAGAFYVRMAWDAISSVDRMASLAVEGKVSGHVG